MLRKVHWEKPVLESLFKKVVGPQVWNFIKNRLQHRACPVNIEELFLIQHLRWLLFNYLIITMVSLKFQLRKYCLKCPWKDFLVFMALKTNRRDALDVVS